MELKNYKNFVIKPNANGELENGSYNRIWKKWGGYCGAVNLTKQIEIIEDMEQEEFENVNEYRIRKLTPKECFRLMGVDDADYEKIKDSGVPKAQQYKLAGNSIVVDVLENIFRKLYIDKKCEDEQLSLF